MNLIIETDIGRDADDFFAVCYLAGVEAVNIRAVTITPGDPDQVAVAKFLLDKFGLKDVKVGVPKSRNKFSTTHFHSQILDLYGYKKTADADGIGSDVIKEVVDNFPDSELFCIGPVTNVAAYIRLNPNHPIKKATMQGGFCSYEHHRPVKALEKFCGMKTCPTFNLNGDVEAGKLFISDPNIQRRFIGKNVCHAVVFNKHKYSELQTYWNWLNDKEPPKPVEVFSRGAYTYFSKHPEKKFHDPTAAVCMLHPEIATWVEGKLFREKGQWGTELTTPGDQIAVEIDHEKLWDNLIAMT